MKHIAFQLNFRDKSWMGGVNYFRNLFEALALSNSKFYEPLIVAGLSADKKILNSLGGNKILISSWGDVACWRWKLRRALALGIGRDIIFEKKLKDVNVQLVSHIGYLGKNSKIPSLVWIPDFQELYFPEFFTSNEINTRRRENRNIVRHAAAILLSSEHAREGLAQISPEAAKCAYVLPFVASVPEPLQLPTIETLKLKYDLPENYYFLPNQFWRHKNHEVVIRALAKLKRHGKSVTVIATGNPQDHRQPEFSRYLYQLIADENVSNEFRVLGLLPFNDLMGLMANAVAVINPSLFEGWSTTVEEAKSLGKIAIISNIPVHKEQDPDRVVYFDPYDAKELANILLSLQESHDQYEDLKHMKAAQLKYPARQLDFAHRYEAIVNSVINKCRDF